MKIPKEEPKQTVQEYEQQGLEKYSHELKSKQDYKKMSKKFTEILTIIPDDVLIKYTQQETLEEAAEKFRSNNPGTMQGGNNTKILNAFKNGAKWQIGKQDNFIIGFLEFIGGTYSYSNIFNYWYLHADTSKTYTKKELLKKYIDTLNGN
jgi:hypothetical protein